jgi:hypothetical protein
MFTLKYWIFREAKGYKLSPKLTRLLKMVRYHIGNVQNMSDLQMLHDLSILAVELVTEVEPTLKDLTGIVLCD